MTTSPEEPLGIRRIISPRGTKTRLPSPLSVGVSLDNIAFEKSRLPRLCEWLRTNATSCLFFVGDYLLCKNLRAFQGLSADDAERRSAASASTFHSAVTTVLKGSGLRWELLSLTDIARTGEFSDTRNASVAEVRRVPALAAEIDRSAISYLLRNKSRLGEDCQEKFIAHVREYLHDEIAFYTIVARRGWLVEAYPGSELPLLRRFIRQTLPPPDPILATRTFIELR